MLDGMTWHMAAPYILSLILEILKFLNYSYVAKIMTRKPKIGNLTKLTELYPFLESKKWYLLFKEILWWRDVTWKTNVFFWNISVNSLNKPSQHRSLRVIIRIQTIQTLFFFLRLMALLCFRNPSTGSEVPFEPAAILELCISLCTRWPQQQKRSARSMRLV